MRKTKINNCRYIFLLVFAYFLSSCDKDQSNEDDLIEKEIQFENLKREIKIRKIKREKEIDSLSKERIKFEKSIEEIISESK
jgi:hypothetical protein